jgi:hypothetical protein
MRLMRLQDIKHIRARYPMLPAASEQLRSHQKEKHVSEVQFTSQMDMTVQQRNEDTMAAHQQFIAGSGQQGPAAIDQQMHHHKSKPFGVPVDGGIIAKNPRFMPSPTLNPAHFDADQFAEWSEDLGPARACLDTAFRGLTAIYEARVQLQRDPTITPAAASVKLAKEAERKHQQLFERFPRATEQLTKTIETLERSLIAPLESQSGLGTVNDAIRLHSKGLSVDNRRQFIEEAFINKDEKTLTALLGCPHYLSGLSKGMHDHYLRQFHEMREPATVRRIKVLRDATALMERAFPIALKSVEAALGASFRGAQKMKAVSDASEAALAAIMATRAE